MGYAKSYSVTMATKHSTAADHLSIKTSHGGKGVWIRESSQTLCVLKGWINGVTNSWKYITFLCSYEETSGCKPRVILYNLYSTYSVLNLTLTVLYSSGHPHGNKTRYAMLQYNAAKTIRLSPNPLIPWPWLCCILAAMRFCFVLHMASYPTGCIVEAECFSCPVWLILFDFCTSSTT